MNHTMPTLPVARRRKLGIPVDTIKTLRLVHLALRKAHQSDNEEMKNCADTVLSAIVLSIKEPRQYVPDTVGYLIDSLTQALTERKSAN